MIEFSFSKYYHIIMCLARRKKENINMQEKKHFYKKLAVPVLTVYFLLNLDELIKLPAVYRHYRKHRWVRDLTR